jgi:hypothetical protein
MISLAMSSASAAENQIAFGAEDSKRFPVSVGGDC